MNSHYRKDSENNWKCQIRSEICCSCVMLYSEIIQSRSMNSLTLDTYFNKSIVIRFIVTNSLAFFRLRKLAQWRFWSIFYSYRTIPGTTNFMVFSFVFEIYSMKEHQDCDAVLGSIKLIKWNDSKIELTKIRQKKLKSIAWSLGNFCSLSKDLSLVQAFCYAQVNI